MGLAKSIGNAFKFVTSATLGPSLAVMLLSIFGSAYFLAECTNIVEAKVKKDVFGGRQVGFSSFFQSVSDGLRGILVDAWTDYCAYAPIQAAKTVFEKTGREFDFTKHAERMGNPTEPKTDIKELNAKISSALDKISSTSPVISKEINTKISSALDTISTSPVISGEKNKDITTINDEIQSAAAKLKASDSGNKLTETVTDKLNSSKLDAVSNSEIKNLSSSAIPSTTINEPFKVSPLVANAEKVASPIKAA